MKYEGGGGEGSNLTLELENCQKLGVKHSIRKSILRSFVSLSTVFCPRSFLGRNLYFLAQAEDLEITFTVDFNI